MKQQSGFGHLFLLVIAAVGVLSFLLVVSSGPFKDSMLAVLFPKPSSNASVSNPISNPINPPVGRMTASYTLSGLPATVSVGQSFVVDIGVLSNVEAANLFVAKFRYSPQKLEVIGVNPTNFVPSVVEKYFNNTTGELSFIGGVPSPGLQTAGQPTVIAQVVFVAKAAGETFIQVDNDMAIYSNQDNQNILDTREDPSLIFTINSPTSSPTPTPVPPTPTPVPPTPTPMPVACSITGANWLVPFNPYTDNSSAGLFVLASGDCANKQVSFEVREEDGVLGSDPVTSNPSPLFLQPDASNPGTYQVMGIWISEFQDDGFAGINNPPEYYFLARLEGGVTVKSSDPMLTLTPQSGRPDPVRGDLTGDGVANLQDLSRLLSNWNRNENLEDNLDLNDDGAINAFDFSGLISILRSLGVIHSSSQ